MKNDTYTKLAQHYYSLNREKRRLVKIRDDASAKIELIETMIIDVNDILCKDGQHIYEHFEKSEVENDRLREQRSGD